MLLAEETFWDLLRSSAHWQFELFLMALFDVLIGMVAWPFVKRAISRHDQKKHSHEHCEELHDEQGNLF